MDSIRLVLAITAAKGWEVHQMHVKNIFSSQRYFKGDLHGAATGVHSKLIFSMHTKEVTLWPQAST
jgi:hypothetical protein